MLLIQERFLNDILFYQLKTYLLFENNSERKTVLINSNFKIKRGTTLSLVGESGSGKSITSLALVSLLPLNASIVVNKFQW